MVTVPEAARRAGRDPETVRRWIRSGKLRSTKIGTQHLIDEDDLEDIIAGDGSLRIPERLRVSLDGTASIDAVALVRELRDGR